MKVHFLGIGGIGVSALAQYYLAKGHKVSGSDLVFSEITNLLKKRGAKITIGKNVAKKDANLTIYSPAVTVHPRGVHTMSYPEALGELTKQHFTIAVCGTHGKSTTTAMLSLILIKAGFDPTVIIGTKLKEFGNGNFRAGGEPKRNVARTLLRGRNVLVIEADEHFGSFLNYWPEMIIVTNIEADHLDYYKNLKNVKKSFKKFIGHLPKGGILIQNSNIKNQNDNLKLKKILKVPGGHNVYDASLALTAARALKITDKISLKALSKYKGAWRRFEIIKTKPFILVSDYGHNPQKVMAALKAAREKWPKKEIWCVYQPHQYQRTYYLFDDFVKAFKTAPVNRIIITDIYDVAGREETATKKQINSQKLVQAINKKKVIYLPKDKIINYLQANMQSGQIIIIMGAGDIYLLTDELEKMKI
ncbi:MAG: UDP-N-acetylmuramate--L-alanine ligase [Candidatus Nealsonbacteria bacterium]|nr:UDP-N-acetylmuramate--L-alanine ligase [Candidatus Nealsonbacteria bacterium]